MHDRLAELLVRDSERRTFRSCVTGLTYACMWCYVVDRAADHGNVEALIKLGIAYLYNEGCKYLQYTCNTCELTNLA